MTFYANSRLGVSGELIIIFKIKFTLRCDLFTITTVAESYVKATRGARINHFFTYLFSIG